MSIHTLAGLAAELPPCRNSRVLSTAIRHWPGAKSCEGLGSDDGAASVQLPCRGRLDKSTHQLGRHVPEPLLTNGAEACCSSPACQAALLSRHTLAHFESPNKPDQSSPAGTEGRCKIGTGTARTGRPTPREAACHGGPDGSAARCAAQRPEERSATHRPFARNAAARPRPPRSDLVALPPRAAGATATAPLGCGPARGQVHVAYAC